MSLSKIEKQILANIKKFTIDEFYIDKGPNLLELFIELIPEDDLVVNYMHLNQNRKIYNKFEIRSDISNFIYEKIDDLIQSNYLNNSQKDDEKYENEINAAVSLCYIEGSPFLVRFKSRIYYSLILVSCSPLWA